MVKLILDTSFLIDLLLNHKEAVELAASLEEKEILKTTSICVYELFRGIKKKESIEKLEQLCSELIVLSFDKEAAKKAGIISNELLRKGQEIDPEDCMIAAIALLNNDTLVTRNVGHFNRIINLNIKSY